MMSHFLFPVLCGLLSCILTLGPVTVSGIREPYSRTAIVYPSNNAVLNSVSGREGNDYTLIVVLPIGIAIFILVLLFFCWVAVDSMSNAPYQEMDEDAEDVDELGHNPEVVRPHPVIVDQIFDLPYTPHVPLPLEDDDM